MAVNLKKRARRALDNARVAAHAVINDVADAAHHTVVGTEADILKVSDEVTVGVGRSVADAKNAAHRVRAKLKKK